MDVLQKESFGEGGGLTFTGNLGVYGVLFWYALFDASCGLSYPEYDVSTDASS